jgi:hypothetical protein
MFVGAFEVERCDAVFGVQHPRQGFGSEIHFAIAPDAGLLARAPVVEI